MEETNRKFSIVSLISDYNFSISIAMPIVVGIFYLLNITLPLFLNIFFILFPILYIPMRIYFFYILYKRGVEVSGTIMFYLAYPRGARIEYEYTYANQKYRRGNALSRLSFKKSDFHEGQEVTLLVDPKKPKRAIVKDVYF
ncbi:DUF3592 domain-containing protein [Methanolobus sp. ZRKC2]|uniref:DUF3592 domain-containing protein n=1 Tax=Methanolobus sp. ZRKC2 TaxID=3125783 RepID=UPI003252B26D